MSLTVRGILERMFRIPAPIIFVTGRMGRGKTDFALWVAQMLLDMGLVEKVATNIHVYDDPRFVHITSLPGLQIWLENDKSKKLYIFDEASSAIGRRNPLSMLNRQVRRIAFMLRKYKGKLVFVAVSRSVVDSTFEAIPDLVLGEFEKLSKKTAFLKSDLFDEGIQIQNVHRTSLKFDTYDIAPFELSWTENDKQLFNVPANLRPCCQAALIYSQKGTIKAVAEGMGLKWKNRSEEVRELLQQHLKHTMPAIMSDHMLKQDEEVTKPELSFDVENNVSAQLLSSALKRIEMEKGEKKANCIG